jgi:hypothetical protein
MKRDTITDTIEKAKREKLEQELLKRKVLDSISVIVQGKVFGDPGDAYEKQLTMQCIESIRNFIPKAEIILSTWEGADVSHLDFDQVVFNQDPGAIAYSVFEPNYLNNNNRQIVSSLNGLKAATKHYAIKMRGDCRLNDTDFTNYFKPYPRGTQYAFFKSRIIIPIKYSRNPRRIAQLIHPSDIFQAGLREDLLNLWDIPLQPEPDTTRAFPLEKRIFNNALTGGLHRMKFGAEQYNWYAFCKKQGLDLELKHFSHLPADKILASDMSVINNFVIQDSYLLGVNLPKKMFFAADKNLYTHKEWYELTKRYSKEVSTAYKYALIGHVYASNISRILWRATHRLAKFGIVDFFRVLGNYVLKRPVRPQSTTVNASIQL